MPVREDASVSSFDFGDPGIGTVFLILVDSICGEDRLEIVPSGDFFVCEIRTERLRIYISSRYVEFVFVCIETSLYSSESAYLRIYTSHPLGTTPDCLDPFAWICFSSFLECFHIFLDISIDLVERYLYSDEIGYCRRGDRLLIAREEAPLRTDKIRDTIGISGLPRCDTLLCGRYHLTRLWEICSYLITSSCKNRLHNNQTQNNHNKKL
jgi:hypothetical protein